MEEGTSNSVCNNLWMDQDFASPNNNYSPAELKQLLLCAVVELDSVRASAQTQMQIHRAQIERLEELLYSARRETDDMREQFARIGAKLEYNHMLPNSDAEGHQNQSQSNLHFILKSLPEKGKMLEAVMKAGPLLQTLLVAGPLPQWRYPPPSLQSIQMPSFCAPIRGAPNLGYDCYFCTNPGLIPPFPNHGELGPYNNYFNRAALNPVIFASGDQNVCSGNNVMDCTSPADTNEECLNADDLDKQIATASIIKPALGCHGIESQPNNSFGPGRVGPMYAPPMWWDPGLSCPF